MSAPFVLAVPSKGRLQENAEAFFTRAGLSWVHMTIHHLDSLLEPPDDGVANGNTTIRITEDPVLNAFAPTLNLGLIVQL